MMDELGYDVGLTYKKAARWGCGKSGFEEGKNMKLSKIFEEKPERWGFRGDPYFWEHLKELAENMDIISPDELESWIKEQYLSLSGKPLTDEYMDFAVIK